MPALSSPSTWRTHRHSVEAKAFLLNPDVVISRRVNTATFTYPVSYLIYDNPDANGGDPTTDVKVGMTVRIRDGSTGAFKGWGRVHTVPSSTQIYINPTSQNDISFGDNDIIEILNEYRLHARIPRIVPDGTIYKDWNIRWPSAARSMPPVANGGPYYIGEVDPGTGLITVVLPSTASYANASSASIASQEWDVIDGTITVGTSASATITATFPAGYRYVDLEVTDTNGETHTTHILVVGIDPDTYPALRAEIGLSGAVDSGWTAGIRFLEDDVSDYPEGAVCMIYVDEYYGASQGSLNGFSGREHIWFTGWLVNDTVHVEPFEDDWDVVAESAMNILDSLPAFSMTLQFNASPSTWFDVPGLDWWKATNHNLIWGSTLADVCDIEQPIHAANYPLHTYESQAGSLKAQLSDLAEATGGKLTVDHNNRVYFRRSPHLLNTGERAIQVTTVALAASDWTEGLDINVRHRPEVGAIIGFGLIASSVAISAVKSAAPGTSPGQGGQMLTMNRQVVQSQTELNDRIGKMYAQKKLSQRDLRIQVLNGGLIADPAWQEWITFTHSATNKRGLALSAAKFVLNRVAVSFNREEFSQLEDWELERTLDVEPTDGITIQMPGADPPTDNSEDYIGSDGTWGEQIPPPYEDFVPPPFVPDVIEDEPPATSQGYMVAGGDKLWISDELGLASPAWTEEFDPGADFVISDFIHAAGSTSTALRMCLVAQDYTNNIARVYYNADVTGVGTWTLKQTFNDVWVETIHHVAGETNGWAIKALSQAGGPTDEELHHTDDNWDTFNTITISATSGDPRFDSDDYGLGIFVAGKGAGEIWYTTAYTDAAMTALTGISANSSSEVRFVRIPFKKVLTQQPNDDANALMFLVGSVDAVGGETIWAVTFNSATGAIINEENLTPILSSTTYYGRSRYSFSTAGGNTQIMLVSATPVGSTTPTKVLLSENGGTPGDWEEVQSGNFGDPHWLDGSSQIAMFAIGGNVRYSNDRGRTVLVQTGDLSDANVNKAYVIPG